MKAIGIAWHKVPMLMPLIALIISIIIGQYFLDDLSLKVLIGSSIILLAITIGLSLFFQYRAFNKSIIFILIIAATICVGMSNYLFHTDKKKDNWYGHYLNIAQFIHLKVNQEPEVKDKTIKYSCQVNGIMTQDKKWLQSIGQLDVYVYKNDAPQLQIGDIFSIPADKIQALRSSHNPYAFDYAQWAFHKNKYHQAFVSPQELWVHSHGKDSSRDFVYRVNNNILKAIYDNVSDSTTASLMAAVLINERAEMNQDIWKDYSRTGIAHIIAISGMHITLFVSILFFSLSFIRNKKYDVIKYVLAIILVWIYIMLTGFPPSAVRAGIMFSILGIGYIIRRQHIALNTLLATAFISLMIQPHWLWDIGFQLSFLSVAGIIIYFEPIKNLIKTKNKLFTLVWDTVALSISVQITITPLIIYYFHQFSVWSVIANIPAALYSTVFMILSLIIVIAGTCGLNVSSLGDINSGMTDYFNRLIHNISSWSYEGFHRLHIDKYTLIVLYLLIGCWSLYFFYKKNYFRWGGIITCLVSVALILMDYNKTIHQNYIQIYNTSQNTIVDLIEGHHSHRLHTDSISSNIIQYTLQPHDINRNIRHSELQLIEKNTSIQYKEKKILWLLHNWDKSLTPDESYDYIILTQKNIQLNSEILAQLKASLWIISSEISPYYADKIKAVFEQNQVKYIYIRDSGAYTIP